MKGSKSTKRHGKEGPPPSLSPPTGRGSLIFDSALQAQLDHYKRHERWLSRWEEHQVRKQQRFFDKVDEMQARWRLMGLVAPSEDPASPDKTPPGEEAGLEEGGEEGDDHFVLTPRKGTNPGSAGGDLPARPVSREVGPGAIDIRRWLSGGRLAAGGGGGTSDVRKVKSCVERGALGGRDAVDPDDLSWSSGTRSTRGSAGDGLSGRFSEDEEQEEEGQRGWSQRARRRQPEEEEWEDDSISDAHSRSVIQGSVWAGEGGKGGGGDDEEGWIYDEDEDGGSCKAVGVSAESALMMASAFAHAGGDSGGGEEEEDSTEGGGWGGIGGRQQQQFRKSKRALQILPPLSEEASGGGGSDHQNFPEGAAASAKGGRRVSGAKGGGANSSTKSGGLHRLAVTGGGGRDDNAFDVLGSDRASSMDLLGGEGGDEGGYANHASSLLVAGLLDAEDWEPRDVMSWLEEAQTRADEEAPLEPIDDLATLLVEAVMLEDDELLDAEDNMLGGPGSRSRYRPMDTHKFIYEAAGVVSSSGGPSSAADAAATGRGRGGGPGGNGLLWSIEDNEFAPPPHGASAEDALPRRGVRYADSVAATHSSSVGGGDRGALFLPSRLGAESSAGGLSLYSISNSIAEEEGGVPLDYVPKEISPGVLPQSVAYRRLLSLAHQKGLIPDRRWGEMDSTVTRLLIESSREDMAGAMMTGGGGGGLLPKGPSLTRAPGAGGGLALSPQGSGQQQQSTTPLSRISNGGTSGAGGMPFPYLPSPSGRLGAGVNPFGHSPSMRVSNNNHNSGGGGGQQMVTLEKMGTGIRGLARKNANDSPGGLIAQLTEDQEVPTVAVQPPPLPSATPSLGPSEWTEGGGGKGERRVSSVHEGGALSGGVAASSAAVAAAAEAGSRGGSPAYNHGSPMRERRMLPQHQYLERREGGAEGSQGGGGGKGTGLGGGRSSVSLVPLGCGAWGSAEDFKPKKTGKGALWSPNHPGKKPQQGQQGQQQRRATTDAASSRKGGEGGGGGGKGLASSTSGILPKLQQQGLTGRHSAQFGPSTEEAKGGGNDALYNAEEDYPSPTPSSPGVAVLPSQPPWAIPPFLVSPGAALDSESSPGGSPGGFFPPVLSSSAAAAAAARALEKEEACGSALHANSIARSKTGATTRAPAVSRKHGGGGGGAGAGGLLGSLEALTRIYPPDHSVWQLLTSSSDKLGLGEGLGGGGGGGPTQVKSRASHGRSRHARPPHDSSTPATTPTPGVNEVLGEGGTKEEEATAYQAALEAVTRDEISNGGDGTGEADPSYRALTPRPNLSEVIAEGGMAPGEGRAGPPLDAFPTKKHRMAAAGGGEDTAVYSYY